MGSRTWYLPFGGYRLGSAPTQTITDRDFTGQRENMELGLLYYNARYYVPGLGRFASADTIVPNPADPQSYNRYSYVRNSPLNFTDPSGHSECDMDLNCDNPLPPERQPEDPIVLFGGVDGETWTEEEMAVIRSGAWDLARALYEAGGGLFSSPREAFMAVYGGQVTFYKIGYDGCTDGTCYGEWKGDVADISDNTIYVYTDIYDIDAEGNKTSNLPEAWAGPKWAIHELGHGFEHKVNEIIGSNHIRNNLPAFDIDNRDGFFGPPFGWQQSECAIDCNGEIFADMVVGWTYNRWEMGAGILTNAAESKANYMDSIMSRGLLILSLHGQ
ncbi:MAG: RHS repeat-associated core domain-containing protein [Anaerolineae bacterium]|nr:RHS repeat-associated core domain-containing protein [Anaerolineae bacterium]